MKVKPKQSAKQKAVNRIGSLSLDSDCVVRLGDFDCPFIGAGFLVSRGGQVATCLHVVDRVQRIAVYLNPLAEGRSYRIRASSEAHDLALLEPEMPAPAPSACMALAVDWKTTTRIGNAVSLYTFSATERRMARQRLSGTVGSLGEQYPSIGLIGTDTSGGIGPRHPIIGLNVEIAPGDSGTPVLNGRGQVIGIIQMKDLMREGRATAIPVSLLIDLIDRYPQPPLFTTARCT